MFLLILIVSFSGLPVISGFGPVIRNGNATLAISDLKTPDIFTFQGLTNNIWNISCPYSFVVDDTTVSSDALDVVSVVPTNSTSRLVVHRSCTNCMPRSSNFANVSVMETWDLPSAVIATASRHVSVMLTLRNAVFTPPVLHRVVPANGLMANASAGQCAAFNYSYPPYPSPCSFLRCPRDAAVLHGSGSELDTISEGLWVAVMNPFAGYDPAAPLQRTLTASYDAVVGFSPCTSSLPTVCWQSNLDGSAFGTTARAPALTTPLSLESFILSAAERNAFRRAAGVYMRGGERAAGAPLTVAIGWDSNDYQLDIVPGDDGVSPTAAYERIGDTAASFGVQHIVVAPSDSYRAAHGEATDSWGWESCLWLAHGVAVRNGSWNGQLEPEIQALVSRLQKNSDLGIMPYVYPILGFERIGNESESRAPWLFTCGFNTNKLCANLSSPDFQDYLSSLLVSFTRRFGGKGFAWDYTFLYLEGSTHYAQWKGWDTIRRSVAAELDVSSAFDNRQNAHKYGVWYQYAGSYTEPIAGDENPETYGVTIPSPHVDIVAASHLRTINHMYINQQLIPTNRMPGFIGHQTERTCPAQHGVRWIPCYERDFDLLGYEYSVISTLATAPMNFVFCFVPGRDIAEYMAIKDVRMGAVVQKWISFAAAFADVLQFITYPSGPPAWSSVDWTLGFNASGHGLLFAFTSGIETVSVQIPVDDTADAPVGGSWSVFEVWPSSGIARGVVTFGGNITIHVPPSSAVVLLLLPHLSGTGCVKIVEPQQMSFLAAHFPATAATLLQAAQCRRNHVTVPWLGSTVIASACNGSHASSTTCAQSLRLETSHIAVPPTVVTVPVGFPYELGGLCRNCFPQSRMVASRTITLVDLSTSEEHTCPTIVRGGQLYLSLCAVSAAPVQRFPPLSSSLLPPPSFKGGTLSATVAISTSLKAQFRNRAASYRIPWNATLDGAATWLIPTRLLVWFVFPSPTASVTKCDITMSVNGAATPLFPGYTSRDIPHDNTFTGMYADLSALLHVDTARVVVDVPSQCADQYAGVVIVNVDPNDPTLRGTDRVSCKC